MVPKKLLFLAGLALAATPLNAAEITRFDGLDPEEGAKATALVQDFFDSIEARGLERTMTVLFPDALVDTATAQETRQLYRDLDANCGAISHTELIREQPFGSLILEQTYVTRMGQCLVKWDIVLERTEEGWAFNWLNFHTLTGNRWEM
jgi:hypothetical protein